MATFQNLEELLSNQIQKVTELEMATVFMQNKDGLKEALFEAKQDIATINKSILCLRQRLDEMKEQNNTCRKLITLYNNLDKSIIDMSENIPQSLLLQLEKSEPKNSQVPINRVPQSEKKGIEEITEEDIMTDIVEEVKDCKKALFREAEDTYSIEPLTEDEFVKIPKYMIGRQTLGNVNALVATINQIMKAKYSLLDLGKAGARKKGELDLYLQFKKEESDVKGNSKEKIYFFTADDYQREVKMKLDKTKLNLLTVLRHCKRLHEIRIGKNVKYQVMTNL